MVSILSLPIWFSCQNRTVFETENKYKQFKRTDIHLPLPRRTIWANSVVPEQEAKEHTWSRWLAPLQSHKYYYLGRMKTNTWGQAPSLDWLLPLQTRQWATELKHLQTTSGGWKPVEYEDRHKDVTAHATASCHWAKLCSTTLMILRGLFAFILPCVFFLDSAVMFGVSVLLSPPRKLHRKPPTRHVSTRETLVFKTFNSVISTQDWKGTFLRQTAAPNTPALFQLHL